MKPSPDPVVPAEHAGAELPVRGPGPVLPGLGAPQIHHRCGQASAVVVVPPVFRRLVQGQGLQLFVPHPVVPQRLDQLGHGALAASNTRYLIASSESTVVA